MEPELCEITLNSSTNYFLLISHTFQLVQVSRTVNKLFEENATGEIGACDQKMHYKHFSF